MCHLDPPICPDNARLKIRVLAARNVQEPRRGRVEKLFLLLHEEEYLRGEQATHFEENSCIFLHLNGAVGNKDQSKNSQKNDF